MIRPNDKAPLPSAVDDPLRGGAQRREALRRLGAGAISVTPLAMIGCGGEEATKADGGVRMAAADPGPVTQTFSIGLNSTDTVRTPFYATRLYQHENSNKSNEGWTLVATNAFDSAMSLYQPTSVPAAVNAVLPADRTVRSVDDVRLHVTQASDVGEVVPCSIYAVAQSHVQGQETFVLAANGQGWSSNLGPARGKRIGTIVLGGPAGTKVSSNLRDLFTDVQAIDNGFFIAADAPGGGWAFAANEWESFSLAGAGTVRYGAGDTWLERNLPAGLAACTNAFFGQDPVVGTVKRCEALRAGGVASTAYVVLWQASHTDGERPKVVVTYTHASSGTAPPPPPPAPPPPAPPPPAPPPPPPSPAPSPNAAFRIGSNEGFQDWMPSQFSDAVLNSRGFVRTDRYDDDGSLPRDAQGWPLAASRLVCWTTTGIADADFPLNQAFRGSYRGPGEIRSEISGIDIVNRVRDGDSVTFDVVVRAWPRDGVFAFTGPVRDLSILYPGTQGNFLRPQAAAQGSLYWVHRFMQAAGVLDTNREITWAARKPAGYKHGYKPWESIFAWLMDYVNTPGSRTRAGWFNVPRMADADYQTQLARLAASSLPSNIIQYWALGNELWNNIYQGAFGPQGMGQPFNRANNPSDPDFARINTPFIDNAYERMNRLIGLETARMAKRLLAVFGPSAFGTRIRPVLEAQHANPWTAEVPLAWLSLPAQVAEFGPVNSWLWSIASAPYPAGEWFEMDETHSPTAESVLAGLRDGYSYDMKFSLAQAERWHQLKNQYGIAELGAYEGITPHTDGPSATSNSVTKYNAHIHPDIRRLIYDFGAGLKERGYGTCCYFVGYPGKYNPRDLFSLWTVNQAFGEDSPKMLGVKDLIALSDR